jgi:hypothetical protein
MACSRMGVCDGLRPTIGHREQIYYGIEWDATIPFAGCRVPSLQNSKSSETYSAQAQNFTALTFEASYRLLARGFDQQAPFRRNPSKQGSALRIVPLLKWQRSSM